LVIIACEESIHDFKAYQHILSFKESAVGWLGVIVGFDYTPDVSLDHVTFARNIDLKLKILSVPNGIEHDWFNEVKILHSDVVNLTILGEKVGMKLFEVSKECDETYQSYQNFVKDNQVIPESYTEFAMKYAGSGYDRAEITHIKNVVRNRVTINFAKLQNYLRQLNRKLRFKVTYNRFNGLRSIPGLDDFDVYVEATANKNIE
jgi:hypothetical protein